MSRTDDELMREMVQGNILSFTELFNRYQSQVINFLYRLTNDYGKAEDMAQDCFLRVYHNAAAYKQQGKFKAWLFTVALNLARTCLSRSAERMKPISLESPDSDSTQGIVLKDNSPSPSAVVERMETEEMVRAAVEELPLEQREVILLKHFHNLKFNEIAIILDCPVDTVKSRMRYGLLKLLSLLKGKGYDA